ncbi:MAG: glycosyltransferase [Desulfovibrio sp.]|nr:glycosyltransferase [Desulfovibrio sp.]MBI4959038.1 glycosyltransferase [Desulfovibrio sp.]
MRVLHLGKYYPPVQGGVETVTFQVAEGMTKRGVRSDILCFNPGGPTVSEQWNGYTVTRADTPRVAFSTPLSMDFIRLLRKAAPAYDILHLHCPNPMAALALRLVNPGAKVVLHWHSDVIRQKYINKAYRLFFGNWLANRADAVIGATGAHVEVSEYAAAFAGKAHIIPFCLDPEPYAPGTVDQDILARLREEHVGKKAVFALGRLISYKGFDVLIQAATRLPGDWVVLIGGSGPMEPQLRELVEAKGLTGKVHLVGKIPQEALSAYYHFCRVFCLPSITRAEMYGMVQLEAMACGRPVVSTRIPGSGVPLVNAHGVTGLTVPPGDSSALANAVMEIDADQALWERMSANGLLAVRTRFSPDAMLDGVGRVYRALTSA